MACWGHSYAPQQQQGRTSSSYQSCVCGRQRQSSQHTYVGSLAASVHRCRAQCSKATVERAKLLALQFYPAHTCKVAADTMLVASSNPIAANSLIQAGSCSVGNVSFGFQRPQRLQLRGHQVIQEAGFVGPVLAKVRRTSRYKLSGQRVPSAAELQQFQQLLEGSLGERLPSPAVQVVPLHRSANGQAAHLLVQVPTAAIASKLVKVGLSMADGLYLRFARHHLKKTAAAD